MVEKVIEYAIFMLGPDGHVTTWTAGAERITGYTAGEAVGKHFSVFYPREALAAGHPAYVLLHATESGGHVEEGWRIRKDGSRLWAKTAIAVLRDDRLGIRGYGGVIEDVSERQEAEEKLGLAEERLLLIDQTTDYAIFMLDPGGRVVTWNAGAERLKGYSAEEAIGRHFSLFYPPEVVAVDHPNYELRQAAQHGSYSEEGWRVRKNGTQFWASVVITALRGDDGELRGYGKVTQDLTERRQAEEKLEALASHDVLTGLPNRMLLMDRISHALERATRTGTTAAVLFVDLDGFKEINDSWGHKVGDQVLIQVAERLRGVLRSADTAGRIGGDEFILVCEDLSDLAEAEEIALRVMSTVAIPITFEEMTVTVTCSVGVASPGPAESAEELLHHADEAMYAAKDRGRAQHRVYMDGHLPSSAIRLQTREELRGAAEGGQLRLVFQPIVDLRTRMVSGVEALVRWQHPARGVLAPAEFIPIAEATGLIVSLGDWVLHNACCEIVAWKHRIPDWDGSVAVNVSAHQFARPGFVDRLAEHLANSRLEPRRLWLETTETVLLRADHSTRSVFNGIRDLGVRLAVDDFGTGYSSLSCLRDFPFDAIKIDQRFTAGLISEPADRALIVAALAIASALDLEAITEGVETEEQLNQLSGLGARYVQGYLISRPMSADATQRFIVQYPHGDAIRNRRSA